MPVCQHVCSALAKSIGQVKKQNIFECHWNRYFEAELDGFMHWSLDKTSLPI
jgi:hypothetical protein